jgi:hypothetical protein
VYAYALRDVGQRHRRGGSAVAAKKILLQIHDGVAQESSVRGAAPD